MHHAHAHMHAVMWCVCACMWWWWRGGQDAELREAAGLLQQGLNSTDVVKEERTWTGAHGGGGGGGGWPCAGWPRSASA